MDTNFLFLETELERASRIHVRLAYQRLVHQRMLVAQLAATNAERANAERCLHQMETCFRALSELWELRVGALDSMVDVRQALGKVTQEWSASLSEPEVDSRACDEWPLHAKS